MHSLWNIWGTEEDGWTLVSALTQDAVISGVKVQLNMSLSGNYGSDPELMSQWVHPASPPIKT